MKDICKYILISLGIAFLYWMWIMVSPYIFNMLGQEEAEIVGTGLFLSFEMMALAGIIVSKLKKS